MMLTCNYYSGVTIHISQCISYMSNINDLIQIDQTLFKSFKLTKHIPFENVRFKWIKRIPFYSIRHTLVKWYHAVHNVVWTLSNGLNQIDTI